LAIAGLDWKISSLKHAAKLNCELTNPNPVAIDAVQVFVVALQTAMNTGDRKLAYDNAFKVAQTDEVRNLLLYSNKRPDPVILSNGRSVSTDSNFMGYLGIALQNTFYELLHGTSFEQSLVNIISRGGDTDTNGCIAGALLGAIYGYSQIPEDWSQTVLKADPKERIEQYPWAKTTDLLEIATRLPHTKEP
jgi:ADP-ribosylglycohydrolase